MGWGVGQRAEQYTVVVSAFQLNGTRIDDTVAGKTVQGWAGHGRNVLRLSCHAGMQLTMGGGGALGRERARARDGDRIAKGGRASNQLEDTSHSPAISGGTLVQVRRRLPKTVGPGGRG